MIYGYEDSKFDITIIDTDGNAIDEKEEVLSVKGSAFGYAYQILENKFPGGEYAICVEPQTRYDVCKDWSPECN